MQSSYLSRTSYSTALAAQAAAIARFEPTLFGFEADPVVTLGRRALQEDLVTPIPGYEILRVDRGGQATIHNPGQLVIFPALKVDGVRKWIQLLADVTITTLAGFEIQSEWNAAQPGVFTKQGKIMACGLRIKNSWSTHGIAINVSNDLAPFNAIRACGIAAAPVDRVGAGVSPRQVFSRWLEVFSKLA